MDNKTESSNLSPISLKNDKQILSKLRRLKIQETVLTQNLLKTEEKSSNDDNRRNYYSDSSNDTVVKVKDLYKYVKNLFDEINTQTHSRDLLADIDIMEMRDKVLEFETKLKSLKFALNTELKSLKSSEQELIHELNEQPKETNKIKLHKKVSSAKYNYIVPSPVRTLMMSPLKCSEVQEFQDFMKNSGNRYGGWNEYNHNIFVKNWIKRFGLDCNFEWMNDNNFLFSEEYEIFVQDLLAKLQGITESDIKSHTKWYIKYLCLKNKQQKAIERWKWSRRSMRDIDTEVERLEETKNNSHAKNDTDEMSSEDDFTKMYKTCRDKNQKCRSMGRKKNLKKDTKTKPSFSTLMKPTTQWLSRTYVDMEPCSSATNYSVENIGKLLKRITGKSCTQGKLEAIAKLSSMFQSY